jgi:signal transduction histidine kinase
MKLPQELTLFEALAAAPLPCCCFESSGLMVFCNPAARDLLDGFGVELRWPDFLPAQEREPIRLALDEDGLAALKFAEVAGKPSNETWCQLFKCSPDLIAVVFLTKRRGSLGAVWANHLPAAIGTVTGKLGHDLNNLTGSISGCMDLLKHRLQKLLPDTSKFERQFDITARALQKIHVITDRLRGYPRLEKTPVEEAALTDLIEAARGTLGEAAADCTFNVTSPEPLTVEVNRFQAVQMFKGLFENALEAMEKSDKKEITVNIGRVENEVEIAVADFGPGIRVDPPEHAADPFVTTRRSGIGSGFGLGLTMTRSLVERWGGSVTIVNRPNGGALVKIRLPGRERKG